MNAATSVPDVTPTAGKRSAWVWLITVFSLLAVLDGLLSLVLIERGLLPLSELHQSFYATLAAAEWLLLALPDVLLLVATLMLFRLRREALQWWLAVLVIGPLVDLYFWLVTDWSRTVGLLDQISIALGLLIQLAVVGYCLRLQRRGVLK